MDVSSQVQASQATVKDVVGEKAQKMFQEFLEECKEEGQDELKYMDANNLQRPERTTLTVSFPDVENYSPTLATLIKDHYYQVYPYLCNAVRNFAQERIKIREDKEIYVAFVEVMPKLKVRELATSKVGTLLRITGQVVRTHPVHPELTLGTFICLECQTTIPNVEQQFKFTQPTVCKNPMCNNRRRFMLDIGSSRFVDFQKIRIQETQKDVPRGIPRSMEVILRAEAVEMVQAGDKCDFIGTLIVVPDVAQLRTEGSARLETSTKVRVGDGYTSEGVSGLKALGVRDLNYRLSFLACSVQQSSKSGLEGCDANGDKLSSEELLKCMTEPERAKIHEMNRDGQLYQHLIDSLFPAIHGSDEVKRGVLLMLFGGVPKTTIEGTRLRGDINVCIVGDPSCAKSQFLKQVEQFSPRAVYTSGKASTAAGLTAAVVKDEESHEFVIEAGALMLADNVRTELVKTLGIKDTLLIKDTASTTSIEDTMAGLKIEGVCCIDEFDKMDDRDQVAIHEAMEQQTISITKAGVKATLNARTSILAAANPIGGRYDRAKSLKQNISLSAPIMSRFDLFFVLVDDCNEVTDYAIARRIVELHSQQELEQQPVYTLEEVRRYMLFARQFMPKISKASMDYMVEEYKKLRQRDCSGASRSSWRITVRQLESMIRLSEAMAKLSCSDTVEPRHVQEAFRLLNKSIIRVETPDIDFDEEVDISEQKAPVNGEGQEQKSQDSQEEEEGGESMEKSQAAKVRVTYEEYKTIANLMILHMRHMEEGEGGARQSELVNWYLKEIEADIESMQELTSKKQLAEKIVERLVNHDRVLVPVIDEGEEGLKDDPVLMVHPNYFIET